MIEIVPYSEIDLIPALIAEAEDEGWHKSAQVGHKGKGIWLYFVKAK